MAERVSSAALGHEIEVVVYRRCKRRLECIQPRAADGTRWQPVSTIRAVGIFGIAQHGRGDPATIVLGAGGHLVAGHQATVGHGWIGLEALGLEVLVS